MNEMWTKFDVQLDFVTKLCGSVPGNPELIPDWLEARIKGRRKPLPETRSIQDITAEVLDSLSPPEEIDEEAHLLAFQRHEGGLAVGMRTIRAHIKDCSRILSSHYAAKQEGERSFAVRALNSIYYPPTMYWIPVLRNGKFIDKPDGTYTKMIHARDQRGRPVNALKAVEYVEGASLKFQLLILTPPKSKGAIISEEDLNTIFEYGSLHGYGGERSDGEGKYVATISREMN